MIAVSVDGKGLVLAAVDLVALIGQTVSLKRRGRSYVGLCPFHQERSPSFNVRPELGFFHCFGCKASGNAIDFVMKRDRVEFVEAMKSLADQYHVELPKRGGANQQHASERATLFDANAAAVMFYERQLADEAGATAREYLKGRGFTPETIKAWHVGFAVDAWDALLRGPVGRKFGEETLARGGLLKSRETGGHYDTFRDRILFPIRDEQGRTVGFGGRVMPGSDNPAKYLNSPETPLFSKGRTVFGLDMARSAIVQTRTVAVVEGYTDVLLTHQCGVENVVSVLGTALTEHHVTILRRFADRIVLLFDGDDAGDLAVNRAVELFLSEPVEIAIATLPGGMDPDEFVLQKGPDAFRQLLAGATDALTYQWERLKKHLDAESGLTQKQQAVASFVSLLGQAKNVEPIRWGMMLKQVGRLTGLSDDVLKRQIAGTRKPNRFASQHDDTEPAPEPVVIDNARGAEAVAGRWLLGAVLKEPARWESVQTKISPEEFPAGVQRILAETIWARHGDEGSASLAELMSELTPSLASAAIAYVEEVEGLDDLNTTVESALQGLAERRDDNERRASEQTARENGMADGERFKAFLDKHRPSDPRRLRSAR